jgi:hypothetical protein
LHDLLRAAEARVDAGRPAVLRLSGDKAPARFALELERFAAERGWRNAADDDRHRRLAEPAVGFARLEP